MIKIALIVGINYYEHSSSLHGCVDDAHAIKAVLDRNGDGTPNFECKLLTGTGPSDTVTRSQLKDAIEDLFNQNVDIALFYFAGHGHIEATGGYLLPTEAKRGDEGVSLASVIKYANSSSAKNKIIILDSCHSGIAGNPPEIEEAALLHEGITILTASSADQYASEVNGRGVFTTLLEDALSGSAANLTGDITPGAIYAHVDQSLGNWGQRPIFKTNVMRFVSLRKVPPLVSLEHLRKLPEFFTRPGEEYQLDPSYEPDLRGREADMPLPNPENTAKFDILQKFNRVNLVLPVGAPHMWHAAMESKTCKLTALGEHYRRLVINGKI